MTLGVLVSGKLGFEVLRYISEVYTINFVLTDKTSTEVIHFCRKREISLFIGNPREGRVSKFIENLSCDVVISVNYIFIVETDIISLPKSIAVNFHGSLLPKYRGRTPHIWAIINGEKEVGITAHKIEEECDSGDIIAQEVINVDVNDTGASILNTYMNKYPSFALSVLKNIENNTFELYRQEQSKATYFGKRIPEDGLINWNWQKERIINWIRALANPYPGAFAYYNGEKIIINAATQSEHGFICHEPNGKILAIENENLIVKTPNGCLMLSDIILERKVIFKVNDILY